jgi:hypothetical protein
MKPLLIILLALPLLAFRPVAVTTNSAKGINENFNSLASEIERRSLNQGGIVHQNLKISSSAHITGNEVIDGNLSVGGATTVEGLTVNGNLTLSGTLTNPAIPTTYGVWVSSDTPPKEIGLSWTSVNVTSITRISAGLYLTSFTSPYAQADYGSIFNPNIEDTTCFDVERLTTHVRWRCKSSAGAAKDGDRVTFIIYGTLAP